LHSGKARLKVKPSGRPEEYAAHFAAPDGRRQGQPEATMSQPGLQKHSAAREAVAMLAVALAGCVFFWKAVALQGVFFHYDHAIQNYPYRLFFAQGLAHGHLPLWTSDIFCGFPLFAESQGNALYPPFVLLFLLLKPWVAYNYYTVLHFLMAGLFTYVLARVWRVGRAGSALAGICYMLAGPVVSHAHHTNILVGVAWLPLLLALIELVFRRRTVLLLLGFAAVAWVLIGLWLEINRIQSAPHRWLETELNRPKNKILFIKHTFCKQSSKLLSYY
jgi:hypothetical protein